LDVIRRRILGKAIKRADIAILSPSFLEITLRGLRILSKRRIFKKPMLKLVKDRLKIEIKTMKKSS
jgi:hypothetical protein